MNIQNIKELSVKLESLGLKDLSFLLFQRICFKPDQFILSRKIQEDKDWLTIHLFFKKGLNGDEYMLLYYDAILQKEVALPNIFILGVNIHDLDQRMKEIDWAVSFDAENINQWDLEDELTQEKGQKIEQIVEDMATLNSSQEAKNFAIGLKIKYWAGLPNQDLVSIASPLKSKSEFTQRFYFFEGHTGITIPEAYRFLQNKWLEKQFVAKGKAIGNDKVKEANGNGQSSPGNSLLKKKRYSNNSKSKITIENK